LLGPPCVHAWSGECVRTGVLISALRCPERPALGWRAAGMIRDRTTWRNGRRRASVLVWRSTAMPNLRPVFWPGIFDCFIEIRHRANAGALGRLASKDGDRRIRYAATVFQYLEHSAHFSMLRMFKLWVTHRLLYQRLRRCRIKAESRRPFAAAVADAWFFRSASGVGPSRSSAAQGPLEAALFGIERKAAALCPRTSRDLAVCHLLKRSVTQYRVLLFRHSKTLARVGCRKTRGRPVSSRSRKA